MSPTNKYIFLQEDIPMHEKQGGYAEYFARN